MNDTKSDVGANLPVQLADERDFALGAAIVRPSSREIEINGTIIALQPRVMQVLVALVRAEGRVVTRDQLIAACWGNLSVGDDAIQRCIAQLRRLAEHEFADAFAIQTVSRVGYRLALRPAVAHPVAVETASGPSESWIRGRPVQLTIAGLLLLVAGAVVFLSWPNHPATWRVASAEMIASTEQIARHPAISHDGSQIAFSAGADVSPRSIYVRRLADGTTRRITNIPGDAYAPRWSPDDRLIAFAVYRAGKPCVIDVVAVNSGLIRQIGRCLVSERTELSWSHSGKDLYFVDQPDAPDRACIIRLDLENGHIARVSAPNIPGMYEVSPDISPDGRWLAFGRRIDDTRRSIVVRDLRSGDEHTVYTSVDERAAWADDSRSLFISAHEKGEFVILNVPRDGGAATLVYSSVFPMERIASGPNGLLAVETFSAVSNLARPPVPPGREPVLIEHSRMINDIPAISPDGTIAWVGEKGGDLSIWTMREGSAMRKIADVPFSENRLSWSPDGKSIAFESSDAGAMAIRIVSDQGNPVAVIPFTGTAMGPPVWSADGKSVIFPGRDREGWRLRRADIAHPTVQTISSLHWTSVETRGSELYGLRDDDSGIWRIDGTTHRICDGPPLTDDDDQNRWRVFRDSVYYIDNADRSHSRLVARSILGGPLRTIAELPRLYSGGGFDLDPKTGTPIYTVNDPMESAIALLHLTRQ